MRYIDLSMCIASIPTIEKSKLLIKHHIMTGATISQKKHMIKNGSTHWSAIKVYLEKASNRKCWYTESKNPGCRNDVEHFRPKGQVYEHMILKHWYWFLTFNPLNYRLSSQFSNQLNHNSLLGKTGGKGDHFPLLDESKYAHRLSDTGREEPILLDPCNRYDTELLVFNPDGRPTIARRFEHDALAIERVKISNLLLNLDFPTFNEDRESLYNEIHEIVLEGDAALGNTALIDSLTRRLVRKMDKNSAYSKAAECYVRCFRDRPWVEALII